MRHHQKSTSGLLLIVMLMTASVARGQSGEPGQAPDAASSSTRGVSESQLVDAIYRETNAFRAANDLEPLQINPELTEAAWYFARFMARTQQYGHQADGALPSDRAEKFGYEYCFVAENIGYQYDPVSSATDTLAARFLDGWKASSGHRRNLLAPHATETGIAVAPGQEAGRWYAVHMFGRPKSAIISFRIANRSDTLVQYTAGTRDYQLPPGHVRTHKDCRQVDLDFNFAVTDRGGDAFMAVDGAEYVVERSEQGLTAWCGLSGVRSCIRGSLAVQRYPPYVRSAGITSSANRRIEPSTISCGRPPKFIQQMTLLMPVYSCRWLSLSITVRGPPKIISPRS